MLGCYLQVTKNFKLGVHNPLFFESAKDLKNAESCLVPVMPERTTHQTNTVAPENTKIDMDNIDEAEQNNTYNWVIAETEGNRKQKNLLEGCGKKTIANKYNSDIKSLTMTVISLTLNMTITMIVLSIIML